MEKKIRHLEMIQGVINRMASNSFMLKGWSVTLILAIMALLKENHNSKLYVIALVPMLMFWILDSYYLSQERLYRALYEKVRKTEKKDIDFSMKASKCEFSDCRNTIKCCMWSSAEAGFYLPLAIAYALVIAFIYFI